MPHFFSRLLFIVGFICGIYLATILVRQQERKTNKKAPFKNYNNWLKNPEIKREKLDFDSIRYGASNFTSEAQYLFNKIPIFCLVLVKKDKNYQAGKATWGNGCNGMTAINLEQKSVIGKRKSSWLYLCEYLKKVSLSSYKWVVVVYDYNFVIMENLRLFLTNLNPSESHYLGHAVKLWGINYNLGQAGYVLSAGALRLLQKGVDCAKNPTYNNKEDYYLGRKLAALNITPVDTSDVKGLATFHPYNWYRLLSGESDFKNSIYPSKCCSPHSISFQAIEADKIYFFNYLLYTMQTFSGGSLGNKPRVQKWVHEESVWKNFLKSRSIPENITSEQYYQIWEDLVDDPLSFASRIKGEESN